MYFYTSELYISKFTLSPLNMERHKCDLSRCKLWQFNENLLQIERFIVDIKYLDLSLDTVSFICINFNMNKREA